MRKTILLMITAAAMGLAACNGTDNNASDNSQTPASSPAATSAAQQPQEQGVSPMQPTGDIDKDAKDMDQQLKVAMEDPSKTNDINAMMNLYRDYYKKQGKLDEFQQKLTKATEERLNADLQKAK